jgi:hypothetical protein
VRGSRDPISVDGVPFGLNDQSTTGILERHALRIVLGESAIGNPMTVMHDPSIDSGPDEKTRSHDDPFVFCRAAWVRLLRGPAFR